MAASADCIAAKPRLAVQAKSAGRFSQFTCPKNYANRLGRPIDEQAAVTLGRPGRALTASAHARFKELGHPGPYCRMLNTPLPGDVAMSLRLHRLAPAHRKSRPTIVAGETGRMRLSAKLLPAGQRTDGHVGVHRQRQRLGDCADGVERSSVGRFSCPAPCGPTCVARCQHLHNKAGTWKSVAACRRP